VKRQSEIIAGEMEILRAEVELISKMEIPAEDAPERAAYDEAQARGDVVRAEWATRKAAYDKAVEREKQIEEIMRAHQEQSANREQGGRRGPEVKRTRDAFEADAEYMDIVRSAQRSDRENPSVNFEPGPMIERARYAIDQIPINLGKKADEIKERLTELIERDDRSAPLVARHIIMTGSPQYREEFKEYVRSGGRYLPELLRAAMSLTSANGGVLVPHYLDPTIILTNAGVYAGTIRALATVKTIANNKWEGVTSAGATAHWTAEAAATTDSTPTFGAPTITPQKADAWITGSYEVFEDSGFSNDLGMILADAKSRLEEAAFATANTGATIPRGVVAAVAAVTASIVTSITTAAFVVGDVHNVSNAVNPRQEQNLAWLAHKAIYSKVRQFDTSGGGGFWANLQVGQPPILLGAPALKSASMTSVITTGTNILLAGDFSQYYIVDRIGMSVIYDPLVKTTASGAAPTGQAGWYAHWRVGADVVNADAFRLLQLNQVAAATALA
jgi:HK97 family phage major capsid protein